MDSEPTREEKLQEKQRRHQELLHELEELRAQKKPLDNRIRNKSKELKSVGQAIYDLKHNGMVPHITDHAIVRYLERVEGWDIDELRLKVSQHRQACKVGNVIVTVMPEGEEVKDE